MNYTGMIYQYDQESGNGLVMIGDGESKEFSKSEWMETETEPSVGQRISYELVNSQIQIKLATQESEDKAKKYKESLQDDQKQEELPKETPKCSISFESIDKCIEHYTNLGFKLAKDSQSGLTRTLSFRYYSSATGDFGEALIKQTGDIIHVTQTLNGQTVSAG